MSSYFPFVRSQSVPWHRPEYHGQGCDECGDQHANPDGAAKKEFLDVWLANAEGSERGGFGLAKEDEDGVEFVLMRHEEKYSKRERDE